jgi:hypothetical protein
VKTANICGQKALSDGSACAPNEQQKSVGSRKVLEVLHMRAMVLDRDGKRGGNGANVKSLNFVQAAVFPIASLKEGGTIR